MPIMKNLLYISVFMLISAVAHADEPTLCRDSEKTYFSCSSDIKVISVCLSERFDPDSGKLTYRFGRPDRIELEYSSSYNELNSKFNFGFFSYAKGSTSELSFKIGEYTYTVHRDSHVFRPNTAGVVVERDNKVAAYKKCDNPSFKNEYDLSDLNDIGFIVGSSRGIGTAGD